MFFIKVFILLSAFSSFADSIQTYKKSIDLEIDSKKLAQDMVLSEVSRDLIIELVGKSEYQKHRAKIEKYILANKNRYILSISSSSGQREDTDKFRFTVTIKVSKSHLEALLKDHVFLKKEDFSQCVLPLLSFSSHFGKNKQVWSWWNAENHFSHNKELASFFFDSLSKAFTKIGFYFIDPVFQKTETALSSFLLPIPSRNRKHFKPIAEFYSCDIVLSGMIHSGKSLEGLSFLSNHFYSKGTTKKRHWLQFVIKVFNIKTGDGLFELTRQFPLEGSTQGKALQEEINLKSQEMIESLIYRFALSKEKDSLGLNRLMIALQGNLSYPEKEKIMKRISSIDELKHSQIVYLSSQQAIYQLESSKTDKEIVQKIQTLSFKGFILKARRVGDSRLEIYAKRKFL